MKGQKYQEDVRKFLFDVNIFDAPEIEEEPAVPPPPPPPTFSELELEQAQRLAFAEGHKQGLSESAASREQEVAQTLKAIAASLTTLFAAEDERAKLYEREAVNLALCALEKLFPLFLQKLGQAEMIAALQDVLCKQSNQKSVRVDVHPEDEEMIRNHMEKLSSLADCTLQVAATETLNMGAFRLGWADGGAVRDAPALAEQILKTFEDLLAEGATSLHDREGNNPDPTDQPQDMTS